MNKIESVNFCKLDESEKKRYVKGNNCGSGYSLCTTRGNSSIVILLDNCNNKQCYYCNGDHLKIYGSNANPQIQENKTTKTNNPTPTEHINNPTPTEHINNLQPNENKDTSNNEKASDMNSSNRDPVKIAGYGIGIMVLFVLIFILVIFFVRKRKRNNEGISKERNIPTKGYDQLDDENYNSYRSLSIPSLPENKQFNRKASNDQMPIYDDVIIVDNKRNKNNNSPNIYNTSIIYGNENSIIMRNSNRLFSDTNKNFNSNENSMVKVNPNRSFSNGNENSMVKMNPNRSFSNGNENSIVMMNPNRSFSNGTNNDFHNVNTSIMVDSLAETSFHNNANILTKMGSREFSQKNMIQSNNVEESAKSPLNEIKQAYSNKPYSPTSLSNTSTSVSANQKYYINNGSNSIQSPANVYIITNQNSQNNPFSDSHVVSSPTNGYTFDLTLNQEQNKVLKDGENVNNNISQNQNFNNISRNYSYRNEESFIKSPVSKQQSYVSSPLINNNNLIRNANTGNNVDPANSNILRATSLSKQRSYTGIQNISMNDTRNNLNSGHNSAEGTPNLSRSSSNKSHHSVVTSSTPVIENIPSGRQTIEHRHSTKSIKTSTATIEKIPSSSQLHHKHSLNSTKPLESSTSDTKGEATNSINNSMVMSPTQIGKNPQTPTQPKSILKNSNNNSYNSSNITSTQDDLSNSHSINIKRMRSKGRKTTQSNDNNGSTVVSTPSGDINIPPFPSMTRNASGVLRGGDNNIPSETNPTTPARPPQLTVFGHALDTPPIPKSSRFPQDTMVLPPTVGVTPVPPDVLGGTDVVPLNTMTLQRKHFHKKNKSVSAAALKNEYNMDESMIKSKHPLPPVPPLPSNHQNNKSNDDNVAGTITKVNSVKERVSSEKEQTDNDTSHYRSKSLPRPNKNNSRYVDDQNIIPASSIIDPNVLYNLEQELTNFEIDFYKENETQKIVKSRNKNSVISILHEERRNMEYYITHCDD